LFDGRAAETQHDVDDALRLSPRDHRAWLWMHIAASAKLHLGLDADAVISFRHAIELNPSFPLMHFFLAAALADLGKQNDAKVETQAGLALDPTFTVRRFGLTPESDNPTFLEQRQRIANGMRKAGVPEK